MTVAGRHHGRRPDRRLTTRVTRRLVHAAVAGALLASSQVMGVLPAGADDGVLKLEGTPALTGLAGDAERSVFWMVSNPTANEVTAVGETGATVSTVSWPAPKVTDVQALAWRDGVLYVGDIGDREATRSSIQVLRIAEPRGGSRNPQVFTLTYPDGAHDAAALLVSPKGNLYVVTRGQGPGIYRPAQQPTAGTTVALRRVGSAPADVSDGTFTADGQQMALRSPLGVTLVNAYTFATVARGPIEGWPAGESITTGIAGAPLMVGDTGSPSTVVPMSLPTGISTATPPAPTPTPSASATPSSGSSQSPQPSVQPTKAPSIWQSQTSGTVLAIGIALVVAILAGAVTLIGRRR
ncbi:hypothetical protein [Aestuariimicrobium sp. T2.26MG-19.2B]|uniref:hypothetical protein n=1 Tax=Aestuariimicrobium sp. T2.26MG-19.2B TaxID=3040679 RepID=UPI00247773F7|nr:hypothetical protein [Aestuariimicrobium sp. T2.26MG-19.2B]CAI9400959.1 hypothetical protein AESSP_00497 [Aestuariimicrobium sp. T2.26MG-19.2B]